jgi:hypothetical protein
MYGRSKAFRIRNRTLASASLALALSLLFAGSSQARTLAASSAPGHAPARHSATRRAARRHAHPSVKVKRAHKPKSLLVGYYNGHKGKYHTIQEAVAVAKEGDWILVGPGDYKESSTQTISSAYGDDLAPTDILVTTPHLHIRGMNRNTVMIDGTKPGTPECASEASAQNFGAKEGERWQGNNGVVVYKAPGVVLQNFSTCNFLGSNHGGDSVWFDGGGSSGKQEIGSWWGEYLSSTSTYWEGTAKPSDEYGIYASNTYGPGVFAHDYANDMSDSGYYIGACPNCSSTIDDSISEANDLGYSGSNSGGNVRIENSLFKNNEEGVATQSQNNDDAPPPQDGICPKGEQNPSPPPGAQRKNACWVMIGNRVIDNNNGGTPTSDGAPGLLGTGMTIAGGRNDLVVDNLFEGNGAWGILLTPYPGVKESPPPQVPAEDNCKGGIKAGEGEETTCLFEAYENEVEGNTFADNGGYKNPSNADIGELADPIPGTQNNCWHGNVENGGGEPSSYPLAIQLTHGTCEQPNTGGEPAASPLSVQATCDSRLVTECPSVPGEEYPHTEVKLMPLPEQPGMSNPCEGVPSNHWCKHGSPVKEKHWA